jgi:hypothetical protein
MTKIGLNVRHHTHNAKMANDWKEAVREICKAIEQLDDRITELHKATTEQKK